ncbi:helix-hairpin-helix domain-containing protein [Mycoplasma leonicaptivi]|uniref:helix-hairpin-helix domain-containing protein n=1 Tax=Mycoplasma leonicaptivi TaxID=36742 RepID=UPI000486AACB|nr:Tex-like N-terminal domain-containing protein [Mycoplasma leonicaptivi]
MDKNAISSVSQQLNITQNQVQIVLDMFLEGNTVPFIARYRQDQTNGLNEEQIYEIEKLYKYSVELNKRKQAIKEILKEKDLLRQDLEKQINECLSKSELESIYEPFKVGKITKATTAISFGLEPFAKTIYTNKSPKFDIQKEAQKYISDKVPTTEFAIENANYIISQWISQNVDIRKELKNKINNFCKITTSLKKQAVDEEEKFKIYYDFSIPIKYIKDHNVLAINRGVNNKILSLNINFETERYVSYILYVLDKTKVNHKNLIEAVNDALKRLILPSLEREIFNDLFLRAESNSIKNFANIVEYLLNTPATENVNILAIDPAFVNGCKLAALNKNGDLLEINKIFPNKPQNEISKSATVVKSMIQKHNIDIVVIGNGTASRETEKFISDLIKQNNLKIKYAIVSETGASVYSASKIAIEEFPDLSVEERSAINIGRKFLDPLNEYVKIDTKSLGIGQYQHDLNQKELDHNLSFKVSKVVNEVGVDVNTATKYILTYISGLSNKIAQNIIDYRKENGSFNNREDIKKVKGMGPKTYEQSIGFMRIFTSQNFLDRTFIHPDLYDLANKIIAQYHLEPNNNGIDVSQVDVDFVINKYKTNKFDVSLILEALSKPIKVFNKNKKGFILKDTILNIENLNIGDQIQGTVENVTDFGIFVYVGLKENLFIHISNLNLNPNQNHYDVYYPGLVIDACITTIDMQRHKLAGKIV